MVRTHQNQLLTSTASFDAEPHAEAPARSKSSAAPAATGAPNISPRSGSRRPGSRRRGAGGKYIAASGEDPDPEPEPRARRSTGSPKSQSPSVGRKFLSYGDLCERGIKFSRVHLRRLELAGHFPMHLTLGAGSGVQTTKAWLLSEVESWEDERVLQRNVALQKKRLAAAVADERT
jgi:hypothetical protein